MKNLAILRKFIFGLILLVPMLASAYPTNFSSGRGYQDYSYVGLGNPNEVLAFAEYNGAIAVGTEISYTLYGEYANYIERIRLWARPYESSTATNVSSVPATYAFPFDNNRPVEDYGIDDVKVASGAQLLAETTDINSGSLKSTIALASGQWVIYLTADIKSEDEVSLTLGEIWNTADYTKIGGVITKVNSTNITTSDALTDGNRVLVTLRKTMFSPYDFYSKYYRIPCITTTSNGTLIAISDARKYHAHDIANDIDMLVRRSTDNGQTWSAPVVVAKGEISGTPSNMNHDKTIGYGDASIAAMPNGKVLLCMVKGNRIAAGDESDSTWVAYRVSDDNGVTWGAEKTIPAALLNNARGCIAPGNMCVVEEGVLKGKVLAAFRSASRHDDGNWLGTDTYHGNIFLIFDPDTGKWTRAYTEYIHDKYDKNGNLTSSTEGIRYIYNSTLPFNMETRFKRVLWWDEEVTEGYSDAACEDSNGDDESVIVEVAENTFLVSHRVNTAPYRAFTRLVIESTGEETGYKYTPTKLTSTGFTATNANGSIIKATDANGKTYIIHAVPKSSETYNSRATRTALTIYTTEYDGSSNTIAWKERVCLSDRFGKLEETAQYSSMTLMADGTVGLLFEEYPQSVYSSASNDGCNNSSANADFIMRSVFMNVRPQDIIEEWGDVDYKDVAAPVITPESQTYHSEAGEQRPTVTITNPNVDENGNLVGTTTYSMLYKKSDGTTVTLYDNVPFADGSETIEWSDIAAKLGIAEGAEIPTNESIIVTAKCSVVSGGKTYTSTETQRNFLFQNPVRKVMIYARPVSGSGVGNPTIVAGSQTAGPGEIITVGVGTEVNITAFSATENPMITFSHFAYSTDTNTDKIGTTITTSSPGWASTADVKLMAGDRQLVFNMLDANAIPNNHSSEGDGFNDVLVLFVYYNSQKAGFKSQIITSGYEIAEGKLVNNSYGSALSTDDNLTEGFTGVDVVWRKVIGYNNDTKTAIWQDKDTTLMFLNEYSDVTMSYVKSESSVNFKMQDTIVLPMEATELHLNVAVQPDLKTAQNLNAVVMFIQNGRYLTQEDGSYLYALLEGQLHPHDKSDPIYKGASMVVPWYGLNSDGVYSGMVGQPTVVSSTHTTFDDDPNIRGIKFYNLDDYLGGQLRVYVIIYAISNLVTDINTVVNTSTTGTSAMFVHAHGIKQATMPTAVEEVVENDLIIASVAGGVQFIGYEERVDVYSMMGTLVATFPLNGVRYVELPKGVYIANGKKFVVR